MMMRVPSDDSTLMQAKVTGNPTRLNSQPADARRAVDDLKPRGADFIKLQSLIPREAGFAIADEAEAGHSVPSATYRIRCGRPRPPTQGRRALST
jgi:hypothetical protein